MRKLPRHKTQRIGEFEDKRVALDDFIKRIQAENGHLVFADEAIFTARGFQMTAWSAPYTNVVVEDRTDNQPC